MGTTTNPQGYGPSSGGPSPWGNGPPPNTSNGWGQPGWSQHDWSYFWHPYGIARPLAVALTILGFIFWWPIGLVLLFCTLKGSGHMGCWGRRQNMYQNGGYQGGNGGSGPSQGSPFQGWVPPWKAWGGQQQAAQPQTAQTSGNHAFDEYRAATIRRLEDEQQEFSSFLERLRFAKDKAEFDQFMAERRERPAGPPVPGEPTHP